VLQQCYTCTFYDTLTAFTEVCARAVSLVDAQACANEAGCALIESRGRYVNQQQCCICEVYYASSTASTAVEVLHAST
jgi:hypothetical protein